MGGLLKGGDKLPWRGAQEFYVVGGSREISLPNFKFIEEL